MTKTCENCGVKYNDETVENCPMCLAKKVSEYERELNEAMRTSNYTRDKK